jgi:hypothetical protein
MTAKEKAKECAIKVSMQKKFVKYFITFRI